MKSMKKIAFYMPKHNPASNLFGAATLGFSGKAGCADDAIFEILSQPHGIVLNGTYEEILNESGIYETELKFGYKIKEGGNEYEYDADGNLSLITHTDENSYTYIGLNPGLKNIIIKNGITYIGSESFSNCTALKNVDSLSLPYTTSVYNMFYNCTSLEKVNNLTLADYANISSIFCIYLIILKLHLVLKLHKYHCIGLV